MENQLMNNVFNVQNERFALNSINLSPYICLAFIDMFSDVECIDLQWHATF